MLYNYPMNLRTIIAFFALLAAAPMAMAAGLGWQVAGEAGQRLYLVGTVHAADPGFYPLPAPIETAFDDSGVLVMEIDPADLDPARMQLLVTRHGVLLNRESLRSMLPEDTWAKVVEHGRRTGLAAHVLDRMRPWLAATTLVAAGMGQAGLDRGLGMEQHFAARAAVHSVPVVALESPSEQIGTLAGLSPAAQVAFLDSSLVDEDEFVSSIRRILDGWHAGDADDLAEILGATYDGHEELYEALIRARNLTWLPRIRAMLASGETHFVAVGALHMVGPDGLVVLLENEGYEVRRLR